MTDRGEGFGDLTPPSLEHPPAIIEGPGGGPAFPVAAPKMSQAEKAYYDDVSDSFGLGVIAAGGAGASAPLLGPEAIPVAVVLGNLAATMGLICWIANELAEDPPQPAYARPVVFKRRVSNPPQTTDPALAPLRVAIQQGVFGAVTGQGYLDAIERLQGAYDANDETWTIVHQSVANLAYRQFVVDLANNGAALYAAGNALKESRCDVELKPGGNGVKKWIETSGVQASLTTALKASGFTTAEISRAIAFFKSDPIYTGPPMSFSSHLAKTAAKIHATATKLSNLA